MFDVSHMGEIFVSGPDAERFVNHVFSNNVTGIPDGKILYGMILYPNGTVVDDLLVYKEFEPCRYLLVVNAQNVDSSANLKLSEKFKAASAEFGPAAKLIHGDTLSISLKADEVAMYRIQ
jgi:glycine cleavage system aminomethyltransferase T